MEKIIGEITPFPGASDESVLQQYDDTCAIKSQQIILESFGQHVSEDQLIQEAENLGIYTPNAGGTKPEDVGRLLEEHDIDVHTQYGANIYDLVYELSQGHKVIVGVDSNELWNPSIWQSLKDYFYCKPNHALVVTGIDTTDSNNVQVILSDPGTGSVAANYPIDTFVDAWNDSKCFMVATDNAPSCNFDSTMVHFPYGLGHIPMIGPYTFEEFVNMDPHSFITNLSTDGNESIRDMSGNLGVDGGESTGSMGETFGVDGGESTGSMASKLSHENNDYLDLTNSESNASNNGITHTETSVELDDGNIDSLDGLGW